MDDFGTRYSSLAYLKRFRWDRLTGEAALARCREELARWTRHAASAGGST